jgi:outer membrane protein OmpA-like peptidoglycan-associated protein
MRFLIYLFIALCFTSCNKKTIVIERYKIKGTPRDTVDYIIHWPDENIPSKPPFKPDKNKKFGSPLETIQFDFDKSDIRESELTKLKKILDALKNYDVTKSDIILAVDGHGCEIGTDEYNYDLGLRRASEVENYLKSHLEQSQNIHIMKKSYGEKIPISNILELNRRVEIHTIQ